jgi:hypothetical protein
MANLGATWTKEHNVEIASESPKIRLAPKPQDVYNNRKKDVLTNDQATKIQLFPLHFGSKDLINKMYSNYVNWEYNINFRKTKNMRVDIEH